MYIIAAFILFMSYRIFSDGDLVQAVISLSVAIIIGLSTYFWNITRIESKLKRLRIPVFVTIFVGVLAFISIKVFEYAEIGTEKYEQIIEMNHKFPQINESMLVYLEDGKISIMEYHDIKGRYKKPGKARAIEELTIMFQSNQDKIDI